MVGKDIERRPSYVIRDTMPDAGSTEASTAQAEIEGGKLFNVDLLRSEARGKLTSYGSEFRQIALDLELSRRREQRKQLEQEFVHRRARSLYDKPYTSDKLKHKVDKALRIPVGQIDEHTKESFIVDQEGRELPFSMRYKTWQKEDGSIGIEPIDYIQGCDEEEKVNAIQRLNDGVAVKFEKEEIVSLDRIQTDTEGERTELQLLPFGGYYFGDNEYGVSRDQTYDSTSGLVRYNSREDDHVYSKFNPEVNHFDDYSYHNKAGGSISRPEYFAIMDEILDAIAIYP
jgi:hypothetical protein